MAYSKTTTTKALIACELLVAAYDQGEADGGYIRWEHVDTARQVALQALADAQAEDAEREPSEGSR